MTHTDRHIHTQRQTLMLGRLSTDETFQTDTQTHTPKERFQTDTQTHTPKEMFQTDTQTHTQGKTRTLGRMNTDENFQREREREREIERERDSHTRRETLTLRRMNTGDAFHHGVHQGPHGNSARAVDCILLSQGFAPPNDTPPSRRAEVNCRQSPASDQGYRTREEPRGPNTILPSAAAPPPAQLRCSRH